MNPLVMFMMDSLVRNQSGDDGGLLYLDSLALDIGGVEETSTISSFVNTTATTDSDAFLQSSGLAVLIIDGQVPATASTALIMDWSSLAVAVALTVIVLLTIGGNLLILAAVLFNSNLRGPTHILIANLAVADLLLGFLVLPFSATLEVPP